MNALRAPADFTELRALLESVRDGYLALDEQWRFTYVNRAAGEILGERAEALLGRTIWHAYPGLFGTPFESLYRRTLDERAGGTLTGWYPDHQRWYEVTTYSLPPGIAIVFRDVTAHKEAEQRIRAEADSLQRLIDANPYGVFVVDDSFVVRFANRRTLEAFASVADRFVGMDLREALKSVWQPDAAARLIAIYEHAMRTGEPYTQSGLVGGRSDREGSEAYDFSIQSIALPGGGAGLVVHFYDLTERERQEAALAASEQRFRAVQESSLDGFMLLEALREEGRIVDFRWLHANAAAERLVNAPAGGLAGRRLSDVHPGNWGAGLFDAYCRVVATGEPFVREFRYARDELELELRISVVRVDDGFAVTIADRSPQRRLEAELEASERRRTRALTAGRLGTWEYSVATDMLAVDAALATLFGLPPAEGSRLAAGWAEFMAPAEGARVSAAARQSIATAAPLSLECRIRRADGAERWIRVRAEPEFDSPEAVARLTGTVQDITETWLAEEQAEAARARLEEATRAANLGIHEYYPETGRLIWDARLREWWGLSADEPVTYEKFVARLHPDDRDRMQVEVDCALDPAGDGRYDSEYRVLRPDGGTRWIHATGQVTFSAGRAVRLIGTVQDVSASRELTERLQAADRQKDVFLATLSHELRNPLAPIRTAAELLGRPGVDAQQVGWAGAVIQRQVRHLAWLLEDLLDLSRITQGKLSLRRQRVGLGSVVDTAVEATRPLVERKRHRLSVSLPVDDPIVDADPLRLAQVLTNLLTNAAKYTDAGGRIGLEVRVDASDATIVVTDTGIGLAAEALPRLFQMFSQIHGAQDRAEGGLGIGLALVRGLVSLHGGTVAAHSDGPGHGSAFTVRLPLAAALPASARDRHAASAPTPRRRVLVVDDNCDAADGLAMLLGLAGHEVRVAYAAQSALAVAPTFRPEVALLDIGLPGMNGYALARAWRAEAWGRDTLLVAVTGWGQDEDRRRATAAGFDLHLTKPVDPAQVEALLAGGPDAAAEAARR